VFQCAKKYSKFRDDYKTADLEHRFKNNECDLKELRRLQRMNGNNPYSKDEFFKKLKEKVKERIEIVKEFEPILKLKAFYFSPKIVDKNGN